VLEVGRITRAHGLRGDVVVALTTTERSRVDPGTTLFVDDRPLVIESSRPHQRGWIVHFRSVDTRDDADALRGATLSAEPLDADDDVDEADGDVDLWVHELVGAEVVDVDGVGHGRIEAVQDNPASDLLVLESGALVPLTFVVGWDERGVRLRIDPPPGLFD
jgi:16S rRNA processing protein RimM